jgi:hypothetical protein
MDLSRIKIDDLEVEFIAVAICRSGDGYHVGVLHRRSGQPPRLLHLASHNRLLDDLFSADHICIVPAIDRDDALNIAGLCRRVATARLRKQVPYALRYDPRIRFDPDTGDLLMPDDATGMTCSTFVVHLFRSAQNPIITTQGWPAPGPEDKARQRQLVRLMEGSNSPDDKAQAKRIKREIGSLRISPEHVAGACLESELPATHVACNANKHVIREGLTRRAALRGGMFHLIPFV